MARTSPLPSAKQAAIAPMAIRPNERIALAGDEASGASPNSER